MSTTVTTNGDSNASPMGKINQIIDALKHDSALPTEEKGKILKDAYSIQDAIMNEGNDASNMVSKLESRINSLGGKRKRGEGLEFIQEKAIKAEPSTTEKIINLVVPKSILISKKNLSYRYIKGMQAEALEFAPQMFDTEGVVIKRGAGKKMALNPQEATTIGTEELKSTLAHRSQKSLLSSKNRTTRRFFEALLKGKTQVGTNSEAGRGALKTRFDPYAVAREKANREWKAKPMRDKMSWDENMISANWANIFKGLGGKIEKDKQWSQAGGVGKLRPFFIENGILRGGRTMRGKETSIDGVAAYAIPTEIASRKLTALRGSYVDPKQTPSTRIVKFIRGRWSSSGAKADNSTDRVW